MDNEIIMGTQNKAVTAYLPEDIEAKLTEYCLEQGLSRQGKKSGKEKAALGTGIIEVLRAFFDSESHASPVAPVVDKKELQKIVSKTLPSNVPTEKWVKAEIKQAIANLKKELNSETPAVVEELIQPKESVKSEAVAVEEPTTETAKVTEEKKTEALILNQADLARRLNSNASTLSRHQKKGAKHFAQWTKAKDPETFAWQYNGIVEKSKMFIVIT